MKIGIDIDDTITNSIEALKRFIRTHEVDELIKDDLIHKKDHVLKNNKKEKLRHKFFVDNSIEIGNSIKVKPNAKRIINKLHKEGYKIIIISARCNNYYKNSYEFCYNYLKRNNIYFDKLITSQIYKDKTCIKEGIDLMIDDSISTCDRVNAVGIKTILFNSENNLEKETSFTRVNTWLELYDEIHRVKF